MSLAVELIVAAVRGAVPILVHGDYDVDGQCAAALLTRVLASVGGRAHAFVPHRLRDGYDFGPAGLAEARRLGAGLIITCDCGITAVEAVRAARAAGIDVIVTDHHLPGDALPPASAVLDPRARRLPVRRQGSVWHRGSRSSWRRHWCRRWACLPIFRSTSSTWSRLRPCRRRAAHG